MREVAITGIGVILPGCDTRQQLWDQMSRGESQLQFEPVPTGEPITWPVGRVRDFDPARYLSHLSPRYFKRYTRDQQLYIASCAGAMMDAGLDLSTLTPASVGIFSGTSRGAFDTWYEWIKSEEGRTTDKRYTTRELVFGMPGNAAALAAVNFKIRGPTYTYSSTCASGAVAIGHAFREIVSGDIDVALASGHDSALSEPIYHMYRDTGLLSQEQEDAGKAIKPYAGHSGNAFGEGAVTLVLEERMRAEKRGAKILAIVSGYRYLNNGDHPTTPDTTGRLPARLVQSLLLSTRTDSERVSFVVGHGNGVVLSDLTEIAMMKRLFDQRVGNVPLISTKPIYGHLLGAASALNVAASALMIRKGAIIPTINVDTSRVVTGMNHQAGVALEKRCDVGVALSFGLGGQNAAILLSNPEPAESNLRRRRGAA
jgi:3-oxoacyl-[acyl-carrier-protein] synthase II